MKSYFDNLPYLPPEIIYEINSYINPSDIPDICNNPNASLECQQFINEYYSTTGYNVISNMTNSEFKRLTLVLWPTIQGISAQNNTSIKMQMLERALQLRYNDDTIKKMIKEFMENNTMVNNLLFDYGRINLLSIPINTLISNSSFNLSEHMVKYIENDGDMDLLNKIPYNQMTPSKAYSIIDSMERGVSYPSKVFNKLKPYILNYKNLGVIYNSPNSDVMQYIKNTKDITMVDFMVYTQRPNFDINVAASIVRKIGNKARDYDMNTYYNIYQNIIRYTITLLDKDLFILVRKELDNIKYKKYDEYVHPSKIILSKSDYHTSYRKALIKTDPAIGYAILLLLNEVDPNVSDIFYIDYGIVKLFSFSLIHNRSSEWFNLLIKSLYEVIE
ncbi:Hypothetical protein ORPV_881 [Orpheovirus IHUMI-LCC2]|uniref:F-box domain-containing protein n=1 Tax=Orpheovirus IHUMI-LCC2 TaxID=2023057 RepID=A0A2I2L5F2_9VIRU|nr:Hypothetical protein ORPV_881 [Orpheovirus IHUMI-LCC2]SNW62785.1 Hypothetical protein ORPV_881 [Orpheovirus IHUMI-LCC2]